MIPPLKLPVDGTRNGNGATPSACERKQLWHSNCPPTSKKTLCGFITLSLQQEDASTTLYRTSTTWMKHPCVFYSEVIFVVFYYFCFIANLTTSQGVKLFSNCIFLKSKTLGYKLNPVLREKSPKISCQKLKKSLSL